MSSSASVLPRARSRNATKITTARMATNATKIATSLWPRVMPRRRRRTSRRATAGSASAANGRGRGEQQLGAREHQPHCVAVGVVREPGAEEDVALVGGVEAPAGLRLGGGGVPDSLVAGRNNHLRERVELREEGNDQRRDDEPKGALRGAPPERETPAATIYSSSFSRGGLPSKTWLRRRCSHASRTKV